MMKTRIAQSQPDRIIVRGLNLVDDLIGTRSFTEALYFLSIGRFPEPAQARILDACLVTLMEHGWTPSSLIARLSIDSVPDEMQVALASGVLAMGSVFAGTTEGCAKLLREGVKSGGDPEAYCRDVVAQHSATRTPLPGFGHPMHKHGDPRVAKLIELGAREKINGRYVDMLLKLSAAVDRSYGRHIPINATGGIAALLLEIGFPAEIMRGISVVARAGGLIGHVVEERETHSARYIWSLVDEHIPYEDPKDS
jgi:citrate synthase